MSQKNTDMTIGNPLELLIKFSLPLMAGNIFQQMYILVDTAIVGNGVGVEALASIGAADWLNWLMFGTATGFTQGFSILIAQSFGAKDDRKLNQTIKTSIMLAIILSFFLTTVSFLSMKPILNILNTNCFDYIIGVSGDYSLFLSSYRNNINSYSKIKNI